MRFLSVAERELRAAARRKGTYQLRWFTALGFFGLLLWLGWATGAFNNRRGGADLFQAFSILSFLYCLMVGATATADCLSRERREGTLGLLFLTNLNSAEIVAGKLCSSLLGAAYPLLAILPILALPVLLGGVMPGQLWRTMLALVGGTGFGVVVGMVASAVSSRQFPAIALASGLTLAACFGPVAMAAVLEELRFPKPISGAAAALSTFTTLLLADARTGPPIGSYGFSLAVVLAESLTGLLFVVWWTARTWRDRPKREFFWSRFNFGRGSRDPQARPTWRQRLMEINPRLWLASRSRLGSPVFMGLAVAVVLCAVGGLAPLFAAIVPAGQLAPVVGMMIAWVIATLTLHVLALYHAALAAAQRLAEDKQSGSLELILCTPISMRTISRGLWLAFARRMAFPAVALGLAHLFLLWLIGLVTLMESPANYPPGMTPAGVIWDLLLHGPAKVNYSDWTISFFVRASVLALVLLLGAWVTLGWVARWLGLRMKHPGFAPLASLALVLVPPIAAFSLICYLFDQWGLTRMSERRFIPMMMWIAFAVGVTHCLALSRSAADRLRHDLRAVATGDFEPRRHWWLPRRRTVLRFAVGAVVLPLVVALLAVGYYSYQNWHSRRDWKAFQQELRQQGQPLELAPLLPAPVADEANFACAPAFLALLNVRSNNTPAGKLLTESYTASRVELPPVQSNRDIMPWLQQRPLDFAAPLKWLDPKRPATAPTNRIDCAAAVCAGLAPLEIPLRALAEAARARPRFQISTNRNAAAVLQGDTRELWTLAHAQYLFELRASARVANGEPTGAADDVLTNLRLVALARQSPDVSGVPRAQILLVRSLQPIWEGIIAHRWNEPQLAAFQTDLARFNLIADFTNAVRRVVLAHTEHWRTIPDSGQSRISVPQAGGYIRRPERDWQPRGWWFDDCIQLHRAGQKVLAGVDATAGKLAFEYYWNDFQSLVLDQPTQLLLQPTWWSPGPAQVGLAQTAVNQTILACALERFRLAQGDYPANLTALLPRYLDRIPPDYSHGRPMLYSRESADRFTLLAFGPNGQNDHGKPGTDDWLWAFPALPTNAPPAKATGRK